MKYVKESARWKGSFPVKMETAVFFLFLSLTLAEKPQLRLFDSRALMFLKLRETAAKV